jgi:hypothetical protein
MRYNRCVTIIDRSIINKYERLPFHNGNFPAVFDHAIRIFLYLVSTMNAYTRARARVLQPAVFIFMNPDERLGLAEGQVLFLLLLKKIVHRRSETSENFPELEIRKSGMP